MTYTEFKEHEELNIVIGSTLFKFQKADEYHTFIMVNLQSSPYQDNGIELHHWIETCTRVIDVDAHEAWEELERQRDILTKRAF